MNCMFISTQYDLTAIPLSISRAAQNEITEIKRLNWKLTFYQTQKNIAFP